MRTNIQPRILWLCVGLTLCLASSAQAGLNVWTSEGPVGGDAAALVADPLNPLTLYAATEVGVFKSTDGGGSWQSANHGLIDTEVLDLAIDPQTPTTLYAATAMAGVFKSTDGGASWQQSNQGLSENGPPNPDVKILAIDPQNPSTLYVGRRYAGLFKSSDGGASWSPINTAWGELTEIDALAIDPQNPSTVYVGALPSFTGISEVFKSTDGGGSWTSIRLGPAGGRISDLAVDPQNAGTVYLGTSQTIIVPVGLYKTTDGGAEWHPIGEELPKGIVTLAIDPQTPSTVYAGFKFSSYSDPPGLFRSLDGGASWSQIDSGPARVDTTALLIDPQTPATIYAGRLGAGIYKTQDGGTLWSATNDGFTNAQVEALAIDPTIPTTVYAGTAAGVFKSLDEGRHWSPANRGLDNLRVQTLDMDPTSPETLYVGSDGGIYKSLDGGDAWTFYGDGLAAQRVLAMAIDPQQPTTLYAGTINLAGVGADVHKSVDGGQSWTPMNNGIPFVSNWINALAIDPETPSTLYAGTLRGVYKSVDGAASWQQFSSGLTDEPDRARVLDLAIDPENPSTLYAGLTDSHGAGAVYKSTDGGASWFEINGGLVDITAVETLALDPKDPNRLWIGTTDDARVYGQVAVYVSHNGGERWFPVIGGGLFDTTVRALAIDPATPSSIYAGTLGRGVLDYRSVFQQPDLYLQNGRFHVRVDWRDFVGLRGTGKVAFVSEETEEGAVLESQDSAVVQFFEPNNWEMVVKVLDGRAINDRFWVYLASATDVEFTATVTDTRCGSVQIYTNPLGMAAPALTDTLAFEDCADPQPPGCITDEDTFCFGEDHRFQVDIAWRDFEGATGVGGEVSVPRAGLAKSSDSGLFTFFENDNWELLVKVLDGCAINGNYWFFAAAATDVEFTLTVTDTTDGSVQTYTNPLGQAASAITDTGAFASCP